MFYCKFYRSCNRGFTESISSISRVVSFNLSLTDLATLQIVLRTNSASVPAASLVSDSETKNG